MKKQVFFTLVLVIFLGIYSFGLGNNILSKTLSNGMQIAVKENHNNNSIGFYCFVKTGSVNEGEYLGAGISHYLEHVVAGGSTTFHTEAEYESMAKEMGAIVNAYTTTDATAFHITVDKQYADQALEILFQQMHACAIDSVAVAREKQVILKEIVMRSTPPRSKVYQRNNEFVFPTSKVNRVLRIKKDKVKTIENKATITFDGKIIPFVNLSDILEIPFKETDSEYILALIFGSNNKQIGFNIDEILNEQEVLVKNFNKHLTRVRNISGATILGSGKVVPILNISDLLKSALKETVPVIRPEVAEKEAEEKMNSVLVIEDSIISRMLLKNILETAGYQVTTAIDGADGFKQLKEGNFNAVVSDVDMPRMNGFDLTAKIRSDKTLSELPIILVTALSKKEDRERGIEVGANAYIVKSSFDQSNLLEILGMLI